MLDILKRLSIRLLTSFISSVSRDSALMWLNQSLLPRLLDDSVLLRDTGSVLLGTLRLRQTRDKQSEILFVRLLFWCWTAGTQLSIFCSQMTSSQNSVETAGSHLRLEQVGTPVFMEIPAQTSKTAVRVSFRSDWNMLSITLSHLLPAGCCRDQARCGRARWCCGSTAAWRRPLPASGSCSSGAGWTAGRKGG